MGSLYSVDYLQEDSSNLLFYRVFYYKGQGFDAAIAESGRLTDRRIELTEGREEELNEILRRLQEDIARQPKVTITYFAYDERKAGGAYLRVTGHVKKIDANFGFLLLTEGQSILLSEIFQIEMH